MNESPYSRRQFLKRTALVSIAGITTPASTFGVDRLQGRKKLGVALVGLGNYSTVILGKALKEADLCYLAGVVSGTPSKAKEWSIQYGFSEKNIYDYKNFGPIPKKKKIKI